MASKPGLQTSTQEECGVWLDTVELKDKAKKKKRSVRPISKLLNPFLNGDGYNLAVALNFTQTKIEMPKTKQTSISNFFEPQRRILKKMTLLETFNCGETPTASTTPETSTGDKKRRHDVDAELSEKMNRDWEAHEWSHEIKAESLPLQVHDRYSSPARINYICKDHSEDKSQPQRKRKNIENLPYHEDPLIKSSKDAHDDFNINSKKQKTSYATECLNSLQTEDDFVFLTPLRTSTQKTSEYHSQVENQNKSNFLPSPKKQASVSQLREISNYIKTASPLKEIPVRQADRDSQFNWSIPKRSPLKKPSAHHEDDSLSMLFTQDSEGFRVIAHRGPQTPLMMGITTDDIVSKSEIEDEDENPFTQDSQGNVVIRHF